MADRGTVAPPFTAPGVTTALFYDDASWVLNVLAPIDWGTVDPPMPPAAVAAPSGEKVWWDGAWVSL